jgi:LysM repeat protein
MSRPSAVAVLVAVALALGLSVAAARPAPQAKPRSHRVYPGQHLGMIAKRYNVTVEALARANELEPGERLRPGEKLYIPPRDDPDGSRTAEWVHDLLPSDTGSGSAKQGGARLRDERDERGERGEKGRAKDWRHWARPSARRGFVELRSHDQSWRGYVVAKSGKVPPAARGGFARLLANADGQTTDIDPQLIRLVAKISDTFGGRPIQIVSGYRLESYAWQSRHKTGHALDFAIAGVPNSALLDFVKGFARVGIGYYPNSHFVHLDVREQWTYWVDYSGPGEPPRYAGFWTRPVGR